MAIHTIIIRTALAIVLVGNLHQTAGADRAVNLDDCLAKAVAQQPPGRPIEPLVTDLFNACRLELFALKSTLKSEGKTDSEAIDEIYDRHVAPMALRAKPK